MLPGVAKSTNQKRHPFQIDTLMGPNLLLPKSIRILQTARGIPSKLPPRAAKSTNPTRPPSQIYTTETNMLTSTPAYRLLAYRLPFTCIPFTCTPFSCLPFTCIPFTCTPFTCIPFTAYRLPARRWPQIDCNRSFGTRSPLKRASRDGKIEESHEASLPN